MCLPGNRIRKTEVHAVSLWLWHPLTSSKLVCSPKEEPAAPTAGRLKSSDTARDILAWSWYVPPTQYLSEIYFFTAPPNPPLPPQSASLSVILHVCLSLFLFLAASLCLCLSISVFVCLTLSLCLPHFLSPPVSSCALHSLCHGIPNWGKINLHQLLPLIAVRGRGGHDLKNVNLLVNL